MGVSFVARFVSVVSPAENNIAEKSQDCDLSVIIKTGRLFAGYRIDNRFWELRL